MHFPFSWFGWDLLLLGVPDSPSLQVQIWIVSLSSAWCFQIWTSGISRSGSLALQNLALPPLSLLIQANVLSFCMSQKVMLQITWPKHGTSQQSQTPQTTFLLSDTLFFNTLFPSYSYFYTLTFYSLKAQTSYPVPGQFFQAWYSFNAVLYGSGSWGLPCNNVSQPLTANHGHRTSTLAKFWTSHWSDAHIFSLESMAIDSPWLSVQSAVSFWGHASHIFELGDVLSTESKGACPTYHPNVWVKNARQDLDSVFCWCNPCWSHQRLWCTGPGMDPDQHSPSLELKLGTWIEAWGLGDSVEWQDE